MTALRLVITQAVPRDTQHRDLMRIVMMETAFRVVIEVWSSRKLHEDGCSQGDDTEYDHLRGYCEGGHQGGSTKKNKEVCADRDHHGVGLWMVSTKAGHREDGHKGGDNEGFSNGRLQ
jgi:hypothetical protein